MFAIHPRNRVAADGGGLVAQPAAKEEFEAHGLFEVLMLDSCEQLSHLDFDAELTELLSQALSDPRAQRPGH